LADEKLLGEVEILHGPVQLCVSLLCKLVCFYEYLSYCRRSGWPHSQYTLLENGIGNGKWRRTMYIVDRRRIAGENGWRVVRPMTSPQARLASTGIRKQNRPQVELQDHMFSFPSPAATASYQTRFRLRDMKTRATRSFPKIAFLDCSTFAQIAIHFTTA
jgi:hypothetical protein